MNKQVHRADYIPLSIHTSMVRSLNQQSSFLVEILSRRQDRDIEQCVSLCWNLRKYREVQRSTKSPEVRLFPLGQRSLRQRKFPMEHDEGEDSTHSPWRSQRTTSLKWIERSFTFSLDWTTIDWLLIDWYGKQVFQCHRRMLARYDRVKQEERASTRSEWITDKCSRVVSNFPFDWQRNIWYQHIKTRKNDDSSTMTSGHAWHLPFSPQTNCKTTSMNQCSFLSFLLNQSVLQCVTTRMFSVLRCSSLVVWVMAQDS